MSSIQFPRIGKRILKSLIGVWLCYVVQKLRGGSGIVFYSQLAVLWCIQPYIRDSFRNGLQRTIGTVIGAVWGLIVIVVSLNLLPEFFHDEMHYGMLVALGTGAVLYTTVVFKRKNASYFSAVVFLSIVVNHIRDVDTFLFVWNRVLDTMIGIALGVGINMFRIPRRKRKDILFISGVDDTLLSAKAGISDFSRVELNRMLSEGANFTVSTMRTPASVIDALSGIEWTLPLIVMDGAALFDMREKVFIETVPMSAELCGSVCGVFDRLGMNCFVNTVIDGVLVISYSELKNNVERDIYRTLRVSPYRNYVNHDLSDRGEVLYLMAVGMKAEMDRTYAELLKLECCDRLKILYYASDDYPGAMYLKIYDRAATKENMIEKLKQRTGVSETLTFGSIEGKYDIIVRPGERDIVVRTLEKVYEPVFFKR